MTSHRATAPATPAALPITGDVIRDSPALHADVQLLSAQYGVDFTDDASIRPLLARHKEAVHRLRHSPKAWVGGISLLLAVCLPFATLTALGPPDLAEAPRSLAVHIAPGLALFAFGLTLLIQSHRRAVRRMNHPELVGYRMVLATATAHRVPVPAAPAWLVGRDSTTDKETHPLPELPLKPHPTPTEAPLAPPVPQKPYDVIQYESLGGEGGWHDEAGFGLVLAGGIAAVWATSEGEPAGYALAAALALLGIRTWLAGRRQGNRHRALRDAAQRYVAEVTAAQRAGAQVPELSEKLRKLIV
ncbi:hypothetical protein OG897_26280 [Streptomyces sp. NBC_00237]|uniref:hypothetical protein n=1 Tax=Streptomyces sp. NBC_00237 TaxID=2975687 RepID=UPI0022523964|nr:hypothetical protein [Streptomyces sp. NBC_00237]MCX5204950.1 hypothetical protein [Streptomyces sp. NBC_00237]